MSSTSPGLLQNAALISRIGYVRKGPVGFQAQIAVKRKYQIRWYVRFTSQHDIE
jgi:hypothetical protein